MAVVYFCRGETRAGYLVCSGALCAAPPLLISSGRRGIIAEVRFPE
nr:MAG TPA: hypothetical protein [Caudoviricetes sp.]